MVLHFTAMRDALSALNRLCDPEAEVSAHYLIGNDGTVWHLVREEMRAWHAGAGEWAGQGDINSRSIGIELDNTGTHPFSELQMAALEPLLEGILSRHGIRPEGVIGHSDMAPGRKTDPGPRFDWARLGRLGLAAAPIQSSIVPDVSPAAFRDLARSAGFTAPADDALLLATVRLRLRPWARGPLTAEDLAAVAGLPAAGDLA